MKSFTKDKDSIDANYDDYLRTELVYKRIYNLREELCYTLDCSKKIICTDTDVLLLAKKKPQSVKVFDKCLKVMAMDK